MLVRLQVMMVALILGLAIIVSAAGTRAEIKVRSGQNWILSKGETHGVKTGMTGYIS